MGNNSSIYKNAERQAEEAGIKFGRLERKKVVDGILCTFFTQIDGEKRVYHWGYNSIFTLIEEHTQPQEAHELEEEMEEEYSFETGEVYATI